ncbi:hypothetical protein RISK_002262 [Rhodopirellula islandica]|uniref:Uncharacterized protein n=1 Tax=Rhodopirellula islandica TaxID=595434 RepID=A0A0J1BGG2_RHOIS|nr:hypothetical protein [Rhodopirellula islandica]KLU05630.1 hypothetical protein RISK_002262 [Rhodopirellula islandica]
MTRFLTIAFLATCLTTVGCGGSDGGLATDNADADAMAQYEAEQAKAQQDMESDYADQK